MLMNPLCRLGTRGSGMQYERVVRNEEKYLRRSVYLDSLVFIQTFRTY